MGGVTTPAAISPALDELSIGHSTSSASAVAVDNNNATPRLVHRSETTLIYRSGSDKGVKYILGDDPSAVQQHMARLEHEQQIFKHLPPSCPRRNIIKAEQGDDGRISILFEWVNGITLEEWLQGQQQQQQGQALPQDVLKMRLRMATAIAKTLNDYHDSGVAHTTLSKMNIIVETCEAGITVNLIHLSQSIVMKQSEDESFAKRAQQEDLEGLGRVYQTLFGVSEGIFEQENILMAREEDDSGESEDCEEGRTKRSKSSTEQEVNGGLPLYLVALISALINKGNSGGEKYDNVKQVLNDLKAAANKFDTYFRSFDWKEVSLRNHLPVPPSAFYGRQPEMSIIMSSLHSVLNYGKPNYCVVSGQAGMGKTKLMNQIKKTIEGKNGHLIVCKYMADGSRPDSVLFGALGDFFGTVVENSNDDLKARMRERIRAFESSFGIGDLIQSIPNLNKLVGSDYTSIDLSAVPQQQLLHRSKYLLCKLIGAIADAQNPVALLFDDLQWCDETTLSVIQTIVTDPEIQYCLYLGCYRDSEGARAAEQMAADIKFQIQVFTINLGPLGKEAVNALVSESMCLPPSLSQPLSAIVHTKTAGSPLFCLNFLSDGMVRFNLSTRRWEYDIKDMLMKEIPPSVVQYIVSQMTKLPRSYRLALKLASCLGHHFDHVTFLKAKVKSDYDLEKVLPSVCHLGFLHQVSPNNSPNPQFMWAHDEVREAAYLLVPENMREQFHLLIGTRLLMNTPEDELLPAAIFAILGHMNKGIRLIQTHDQKYEAAKLNLLAGETCIKTSSFHSAADYFTSGIKLLPEDCWEFEYNLTLNLHDAAQEALFVIGDFHKLRLLSAEVITKAKKFDDKLNSYNNLVRYLVSLDKMEEAMSTCTSVLSELGEPMPAQVTNEACYHAIVTTKTMLAKYPGDQILNFPRMTDARRLAAMESLQLILLSSFNSPDPRMGVLLVSKAIQMSLEFGLCEASTFAFAMYGTMLVHGTMKDLEGGYFYGNLAIKLLNVLRASRFKARVFTMVYGLIHIWRDPWQASLGNLLEGYNAGCITGDIEYAFRSTHIYSELALHSGRDLKPLKDEMITYAKRALQCKQIGAELGIVPYLSAVLELTGDASKEDIYQVLLNTTEEALFQLLESRNDRRVCFSILNNRKIGHIFKGDMESATQVHNLILNHPVISANMEHIRTMPYIIGAFADGLIAFFCARKNEKDKDKWTKTGEDMIKTFKSWEISSKWNFSNKLYLLQGECYCNLGQNELAFEKYDAAIKAARDHRFTHEEGLAHYLCGQSHLRHGQQKEAVIHFTEARKCYERWGAIALVQIMESEVGRLTQIS
eukprot:CAMPEP_0172331684 /NCGR_PEP_ID=MMETSP1058-20130122/62053_1 /TAXON_ID=83371 /ORGANISM="Detonula confervacea, Strain CCMP 353" /LENGTH=1323 /DNA_ID=CAMNT_0013048953 /DNA_START=104 /DNA_END=4075 /DNA_ORIENTATION=+